VVHLVVHLVVQRFLEVVVVFRHRSFLEVVVFRHRSFLEEVEEPSPLVVVEVVGSLPQPVEVEEVVGSLPQPVEVAEVVEVVGSLHLLDLMEEVSVQSFLAPN
jgi:hypothetical protein